MVNGHHHVFENRDLQRHRCSEITSAARNINQPSSRRKCIRKILVCRAFRLGRWSEVPQNQHNNAPLTMLTSTTYRPTESKRNGTSRRCKGVLSSARARTTMSMDRIREHRRAPSVMRMVAEGGLPTEIDCQHRIYISTRQGSGRLAGDAALHGWRST